MVHMLQEEFYNTADIAGFLFDRLLKFKGANDCARRWFPQAVEDMRVRPRGYSCYEQICLWSRSPQEVEEFQDGEQYYRCQLQPIQRKGNLRGYILSVMNVTREHQEVILMGERKAEAERVSEQKSRFLAAVSHELRSPLHAIIGGSEILMRQKGLNPENEVLLKYMNDAGNHLLGQVNEILSYSKLEAGMLSLEEQEYNLYAMLEEQAGICFLNLKDKPVKFELRLTTPCPKKVIGDEKRVRQVVQNLLSNAVKYTDEGMITFLVSIHKKEERLLIHGSVEDTGMGMTGEMEEHIFDEYISFADRKEGRQMEGTGLGLSIVKQLVELMGGWVKVESKAGEGTCFTFEVQQKAVEEEFYAPVCMDHPVLNVANSGLRKEEIQPEWVYPDVRILLVDDMEVNRYIFRELAKPWEVTVDLAASGQEALALVRQNSYQMVILDQMMPGMTGLETAKEIRSLTKVPMILMTADVSDEIRERLPAYGFVDYIFKPVRTNKLKEVLEGHLPVTSRRVPRREDSVIRDVRNRQEILSYVRTLDSYCRDVRQLLPLLEEYEKEDLSLFRTKVHGIKGISRQIRRDEIGEYAEVMEMAAKTENRSFLERHLAPFLEQLQQVCREVEGEREEIVWSYQLNPEQKEKKELAEDVRKELWQKLKDSFEEYDIEKIENYLGELKETVLSDEEKNRLLLVEEACENLDYEAGSNACSC